MTDSEKLDVLMEGLCEVKKEIGELKEDQSLRSICMGKRIV